MQELVRERLQSRLGPQCHLTIYESQSHIHHIQRDLNNNNSVLFSSLMEDAAADASFPAGSLQDLAVISLAAGQKFQLLEMQTQKTSLKSLNHLLFYQTSNTDNHKESAFKRTAVYVFSCKGSAGTAEFICCVLAPQCALNSLKQITNHFIRPELEEMLVEMTK